MTDLVPSDEIEIIVGTDRDEFVHYGIADFESRRVFILHSWACLDRAIDLRDCEFSLALGEGINEDAWKGFENKTVVLAIDPVLGLIPA